MNINMVAANRCKWVAWGFCKVKRIHGWNNTATQVYIQLHETPPLTATGLVPANQVPNIKSFVAQPNSGFDYEFDGISCAELTIAISTNELKFVDPGANNGLDMTVEVDTMFDVRTGDAIAGDLTTGVNSLQAWASASGPKTLLRVDWTSAEAATTYLQIHAADAPANGAKPVIQGPANTDQTGLVQQNLNFGDASVSPLSQAANVQSKGCNIYPSTTSGSLTAISDSACAIRAIYRP